MRATVLIYGEAAWGKELVARAIHFASPRREHGFVALNCAAMPAQLIESELFGHEKGAFTGASARTRGKFELAHRGTLFLDEIGEMDPTTQAKLLRVLDEKEFMRVGGDQSLKVDVRVIAATNATSSPWWPGPPSAGLYYRSVVTITVPPLRERRADIPQLIDIFLGRAVRGETPCGGSPVTRAWRPWFGLTPTRAAGTCAISQERAGKCGLLWCPLRAPPWTCRLPAAIARRTSRSPPDQAATPAPPSPRWSAS